MSIWKEWECFPLFFVVTTTLSNCKFIHILDSYAIVQKTVIL